MVGATSSKFCPVLPFGKVTVRCRVHPRLINPCSCAAASWLRTLFSTCITTNNICMKIIHIPDSVIVCFGILILRICYHTTKKDFLQHFVQFRTVLPAFSLFASNIFSFQQWLFSPPFHCFSAGYMKKFYVIFSFSYVWRWIVLREDVSIHRTNFFFLQILGDLPLFVWCMLTLALETFQQREEKKLTKSRRKQEVWVF